MPYSDSPILLVTSHCVVQILAGRLKLVDFGLPSLKRVTQSAPNNSRTKTTRYELLNNLFESGDQYV